MQRSTFLHQILLWIFAAIFASPAARAQVNQYTDTITGFTAVNETATPCTSPLQVTFNVTDTFVVGDVDVAALIEHTYRGDLQLTLRSPAGTSAALTTRNGSRGGDNFNVRLNDEGFGTYLGLSNTATHTLSAPPYQHDVVPQSALSVFDGESANGTWTLDICDGFNADSGDFERADLFLTEQPPTADLSLAMTPSTLSPDYGNPVTITLALSNAGPNATSGVQVTYPLPDGLTYQSDTGGGAYNSSTGVWTVPGSVAVGTPVSLSVTAVVETSGSYVNQAEVTTTPLNDNDSTPGNASTNPFEDDTAAATLTPGFSGTPGVAPTLSCTAEVFDWDTPANAWPSTATLSQTYPTGGTDGTSFGFAWTGDTGERDTSAAPATSQNQTGGLSPTEDALYYIQSLDNGATEAVLTISVGQAGQGVAQLQFSVFDIDFASGQFRDVMLVSGLFNGTSVSPVLTPSSANAVAGSSVYGTAGVASNLGAANFTATFLEPVDTVVLRYQNPEPQTAATRNQAMAIHDFSYCPRERDFGDGPSTAGSAEHLIRSGVFIGATAPDAEGGAPSSAAATGDDAAGTDDEDAIDFSSISQGASTTLSVPVTGSGGYLQMWIDWNDDGDFNDTVGSVSERVATDLQITGASGTLSVPVTVPLTAATTQTVARLRWSTQSGLGVSGVAGDGEVEDHALTITSSANLAASKTSAVYDPTGAGIYALPGNDVTYTISVTNNGGGAVDNNSVELVDRMPPEIEFWNGDMDDGGSLTTVPVAWAETGSGLTFTYATDVRFSTSTTPPANFAACPHASTDPGFAPDSTYNDAITFICFNPKGAFAGNTGTPPTFSVTFRGRIE